MKAQVKLKNRNLSRNEFMKYENKFFLNLFLFKDQHNQL